jgi:cytochrome c peroxidase
VAEAGYDDFARALATYQRTLISGDSPFDRYYYGGERDAISAPARRGLELFARRADCARCHRIGRTYALFTDFQSHFLGVGYNSQPGGSPDIGIGAISNRPLEGFFQTPSLRNVAETAPYMHDGSMETLEEVVEFYDRGGDAQPGRPGELRPLHLTAQDKESLVAFLRSLTGSQRYSAQGRRLPPRESAAGRTVREGAP